MSKGGSSVTDTSFILWLQQFSNGFLDVFFTYITKLGNPEYYMLAIPLFYWCINKKAAFRFTMYFLISIYVNSVVKATTAVPRPSSDEVRILYKESTLGTSSFPSGHTQGTASFWGYMAYYIKSKVFTVIAVTIILLFIAGYTYSSGIRVSIPLISPTGIPSISITCRS